MALRIMVPLARGFQCMAMGNMQPRDVTICVLSREKEQGRGGWGFEVLGRGVGQPLHEGSRGHVNDGNEPAGNVDLRGDIKRLEVLVVEAKDVDLGWVLAE